MMTVETPHLKELCNFQNCLDNNPKLLSMYVKEYPGFRQELYQAGELGPLWERLDRVAAQARVPLGDGK